MKEKFIVLMYKGVPVRVTGKCNNIYQDVLVHGLLELGRRGELGTKKVPHYLRGDIETARKRDLDVKGIRHPYYKRENVCRAREIDFNRKDRGNRIDSSH